MKPAAPVTSILMEPGIITGMPSRNILVTGGAGYIGSHVLVGLLAAGHRCLSIDNYSNSSPAALEWVARIAGRSFDAHDVDIRDASRLRELLARSGPIDSVIHLAGLKSVGESVERPLDYYDNNVAGTLRLLEALRDFGVRDFVFSSSATVYGAADRMPLGESAPVAPQNPYGHTKWIVERMLADLAVSDRSWKVASLRYFNPVGAHESGLIGEHPSGVPNNLMPYLCQVAAGRREKLRVFGNDYPTADGTGVRDYIHVMDLAAGHLAALAHLEAAEAGSGMTLTVNLGTGRGYSVLELADTFECVNGVRVPREMAPRRAGDVAVCFADPSLARARLGWEAKRGLDEMCRDAWRWQQMNPDGYGFTSPS
jgi:UDP-glucose 4-epimerase